MIIVTARRVVARRIAVEKKKKSYAYQAIAISPIATPENRGARSGCVLVPEAPLTRENGTYEGLFPTQHLYTCPHARRNMYKPRAALRTSDRCYLVEFRWLRT